MAIDVVPRDEVLQRDGDGPVEASGLGRVEHCNALGRHVRVGKLAVYPRACAWVSPFFNSSAQPGCLDQLAQEQSDAAAMMNP